ncbi:hypothetical protein WDU94_006175 [Cyamophila willieti]
MDGTWTGDALLQGHSKSTPHGATKTSKNQKDKKKQPQRQSTVPDTSYYGSSSCGVPKSPCEASHNSSSRALATTSSSASSSKH